MVDKWHAMGNTLSASALFATYVPVNVSAPCAT
jgi:hypothetical protein